MITDIFSYCYTMKSKITINTFVSNKTRNFHQIHVFSSPNENIIFLIIKVLVGLFVPFLFQYHTTIYDEIQICCFFTSWVK